MKYALIGCGRISPNHIEAAKNNNLDFVAMCDIVPEVMREKSDRFGLESVRKYTDYKELLVKEKPELVAIATESGKHAAIALDCIAAKPERKLGLLYAQTIRTGLISLFSISAKHWKKDALESFPMVQLMCAGTVARDIMSRPPGAEPGHKTAAVS